MTKLTLKKPIHAHGAEVASLEFATPNGGNMRRCGIPYRLEENRHGETVAQFDAEVVARYISELAQIPPSSVNQLCVGDFQSAMNLVIGFFGDATSKKPSIDTGSSPNTSVED